MAWTETARRDHARRGRCYSSDLTDREWTLIAPLLPGPRRLGRPRTTDLRDVVNAIHCIAATGCQWSLLPRDFPPFTTVQRYFYDWRNGGLLRAINHLMVMAARELEGREASPSAGVIESQSVKTTESGGPRHFGAGKRILGRKRHIVADTLGLMVGAIVHPVNLQDRDGAPMVLRSIRTNWPWLRHVFADGGCAGPKLRGAMKGNGTWRIEIIKRSDAAQGFELLPRRWVVERTFAWLGRCRRLAKDWEASIPSAEAWLMIAHIRIMIRRFARFLPEICGNLCEISDTRVSRGAAIWQQVIEYYPCSAFIHVDLGPARQRGERFPVREIAFAAETPPARELLADSRTMKGGGAAGAATLGAAGVEVAQSVLAETQTAILPLVPYLDTLRWVFIAVALGGIAVTIYARLDD